IPETYSSRPQTRMCPRSVLTSMPRKNKKSCSAASSRARKRSQPRSCSVTTTPSSPRRLASRMSSMGLRLLSAECQLVWMCRSKIIPRFLSGSRRCRCNIHRLQRLVYSICGAVVSNKKKRRPIPPCPLTAHRVGCAHLYHRKLLKEIPYIEKCSEKGNAQQGFFEDADFECIASCLPEGLKD